MKVEYMSMQWFGFFNDGHSYWPVGGRSYCILFQDKENRGRISSIDTLA